MLTNINMTEVYKIMHETRPKPNNDVNWFVDARKAFLSLYSFPIKPFWFSTVISCRISLSNPFSSYKRVLFESCFTVEYMIFYTWWFFTLDKYNNKFIKVTQQGVLYGVWGGKVNIHFAYDNIV